MARRSMWAMRRSMIDPRGSLTMRMPLSTPSLRIQRTTNGAADVLLLVVEADIDFIEPARFGPALAKLAPIVDRLARRPSVAPAGEVAEGVGGHLLSLQ